MNAQIQHSNHAVMREKVPEILGFLKDLTVQRQLGALQPYIAACQNQAAAADRIDVAVFGRFKAGKSSFLNHLVGRSVLPVAVVPLTAVITRLKYGPVDRAEVMFLNGHIKDVPLNQIARYVTEKENPRNEKNVQALTIELPELAPLTPLEFVDTPGLGSAFAHNSQATTSWLPNVGAALVAISSDAPLSERDLNLIRDILQYTPQVVLLLTKADLLNEEQQQEVLQFVKETIRHQWNTDLPVFFYSIKPGFEHLRRNLIESVFKPLLGQRDRAAAEILTHKLRTALRRARNYLEVGLAAVARTEAVRAQLAQRLAEEKLNITLFREQLELLVRELDATAFEQTLARLEPDRRALEERLVAELREKLAQWSMPVPRLLDTYNQWLTGALTNALARMCQNHCDLFLQPLDQLRVHLEQWVRSTHQKLAQHVRDALGIELEPMQFKLEVPPPETPPVDVGVVFDVALDLIGYLIPMWLFGGRIRARLIKQTRYEVRKNLSRLTAAWRDRVTRAMRLLQRQALDRIESELASLEAMSGQALADREQLTALVRQIDSYLAELDDTH